MFKAHILLILLDLIWGEFRKSIMKLNENATYLIYILRTLIFLTECRLVVKYRDKISRARAGLLIVL